VKFKTTQKEEHAMKVNILSDGVLKSEMIGKVFGLY
jgi:hypothetical protein